MTPVRFPLDHRKVLSSAMKRIALALLALMSTTLVACSGGQQSGSSLVGPSGLSASSAANSGSLSGLGDSRLPAIVVNDAISCPSDAPLVLLGSKDTRLDIEWSPIPRVQGYQVSIEEFNVSNEWTMVQLIETSAVRAEWNGKPGAIYRVRVRSRVCGAFGLWSQYDTKGLTDPQRSTPEKPVEECERVDVPMGDYRARTQVSNCEPVCPTYGIDGLRSRMTAPETTCPPPCQTQDYYPSMAAPQPDPCAPPCDQLSYGSKGWTPEPAPCTPPCQPVYYPDRVSAKGRPDPALPICEPTYYPLP
jgi:hypothetical protein